MSTLKKLTAILFSLSYGIISFGHSAVSAGDSLMLYTPYTKVSVPPGESIDYSIDVINNGDGPETLDLVVSPL